MVQENDIALAVAEQTCARSWGTSLALQQLVTRFAKAREPGLPDSSSSSACMGQG